MSHHKEVRDVSVRTSPHSSVSTMGTSARLPGVCLLHVPAQYPRRNARRGVISTTPRRVAIQLYALQRYTLRYRYTSLYLTLYNLYAAAAGRRPTTTPINPVVKYLECNLLYVRFEPACKHQRTVHIISVHVLAEPTRTHYTQRSSQHPRGRRTYGVLRVAEPT